MFFGVYTVGRCDACVLLAGAPHGTEDPPSRQPTLGQQENLVEEAGYDVRAGFVIHSFQGNGNNSLRRAKHPERALHVSVAPCVFPKTRIGCSGVQTNDVHTASLTFDPQRF